MSETESPYIITKLKKGDKFSEHNGGRHGIRVTAIEDSKLNETTGCWEVKGEMEGGHIVEFSADKNFMHYGPKLYLGDIPYLGIIYIQVQTNVQQAKSA